MTKYMLKHISLIFLIILILPFNAYPQKKREFRGAWIQCVNGQFQGMTPSEMRETLSNQLDILQNDGVNAIIFQVRPECDALYQSSLEPWSRFLTGEQGKAPQPFWDPLKWIIDQCHKRGMELHAWINPYRAKTKATTQLSSKHIAVRHPERIFEYDGQYILNPAIDDNRRYICNVVGDILRRYDVDGLHIDDYFYPYPVSGETIPDKDLFEAKSNGLRDIGDWRRFNVSRFIKELHDTITSVKPWVKFGISPFGIYRNKANSNIGSDTNGLQNYDDLYADVLLWINNGWIDYCAPQLYWQIGHPTADYETLIKWWNRYASNRPLFIGEDVERTVAYPDTDNPSSHQLPAKMRLHSQMENVDGTILWYAKAVVDNKGNYGGLLRDIYWKWPALQPLMPFKDSDAPKAPSKLKAVWTSDGYFLFWTAPKWKKWQDEVVSFVVYRFGKGEKVDLSDPSHIVAITRDSFLKLPYDDGKEKWTYVVTSLDRMSNESKPAKKNVKL